MLIETIFSHFFVPLAIDKDEIENLEKVIFSSFSVLPLAIMKYAHYSIYSVLG